MRENFGEIKLDTSDHKKSETPEDSFFGEVLVKMKKEDPQLAHLLNEIDRSDTKKKLITDALLLNGCDWLTVSEKRDDQETMATLGHLLAFWDTNTPEQHQKAIDEFAKKLR